MRYTLAIKRLLMQKDKIPVILCLLIFTIATGLRVHKLYDFPPSPFLDEYNLALDAINSWLGNEHIAWNAFGWYGTPELFIKIFSYVLRIFNFSSSSFRIIWGVVGWLLLVVAYKLTKKMFNNETALIALSLLGISIFHINISRWGHGSVIMTTLIWLTSLGWYFFYKEKKMYFIILAALSFVLGLYSYVGMRIYLVFNFLMSISILLVDISHESFNISGLLNRTKPVLVFWALVIVLWMPQIYAGLTDPVSFLGRTKELSIIRSEQSTIDNLSVLAQSMANQAKIFSYGFDFNLRHNPLVAPIFPYTTIIFAFVGLLVLIRKKLFYEASLIVGLAMTAWFASVLSGMDISIFRAQPLLLSIYILAAVGWWQSYLLVTEKLSSKSKDIRVYAIIGLIYLLFFLPVLRLRLYFKLAQHVPEPVAAAFSYREFQLSKLVRRLADETAVYVSPNSYWLSSLQYELLVQRPKHHVGIFNIDNSLTSFEYPSTFVLAPEYKSLIPSFKENLNGVRISTQDNFLVIRAESVKDKVNNKAMNVGAYRYCITNDNTQTSKGVDATIYSVWAKNEPFTNQLFTCVWNAQLRIDRYATYQFRLFADDWASVDIKQDGRSVMSIETDAVTTSQELMLKPGVYSLIVHYKNIGGDKRVGLLFKTHDQSGFRPLDPVMISPLTLSDVMRS